MSKETVKKCLLLFVLVTTAALLAAASGKDAAGNWHGFWTSADTRLAVDSSNNVSGSIHWTLRKSPRPEEQRKIGLSGTEHVSGIFLPEGGVLRRDGTSLDDPNHVLGTDKYRLVLSDDASVLGGRTWDHGPWNGQFLLQRRP